MVQAKRKKSKPKKQAKVKQHGKQADITQFRSQLDALGLKIIQVTSDGNCFFRSLADQLEGNEEEHRKYRVRVVQYIEKHREDFEPFIEDDLPFDEYCASMEEDGTWAGHMELQAASLVTRSNICIHQFMSPRWYIRNFHGHQASMFHLSYHDGEHYNSVRIKEDPCDGPAKPIIIKMDADISKAIHHTKDAANRSRETSCARIANSGSIKLVMTGTGCKNYNKVQEVLREVDGDVDAAIEFLIAEQETNESGNDNDEHFYESDVPLGDLENGNCKQLKDATQGMTCEQTMSTPKSDSVHHLSSQQDDKTIAGNKLCPCGSKKKHKACCGSAKAKFSAASVINENSARKGGKETRNNRKGGESSKGAASHHGSAVIRDMDALCI